MSHIGFRMPVVVEQAAELWCGPGGAAQGGWHRLVGDEVMRVGGLRGGAERSLAGGSG